MNEHYPAAGHMSVPVLLALCLVTGCSEGGVERPVRDVPTFHGTIDLEFGEIEGEDPYLFTRIESMVEGTLPSRPWRSRGHNTFGRSSEAGDGVDRG